MSGSRIELYGAPYPIILDKLETSDPKQPNPFVVIDGVVYISQAKIEDCSIAAKLSGMRSVQNRAYG